MAREKKFNPKDWKSYVMAGYNHHYIHKTIQERLEEDKAKNEVKICDGLALPRENVTRNINVMGDFKDDVRSICLFLSEKYGKLAAELGYSKEIQININESDLGRYVLVSIFRSDILKKIIDVLDESGQGWFSKRG